MQTTITEALAEIKTIGARITKKREFITQYVARQEIVRDPLLNQGGSPAVLKAEIQSARDLAERAVAIRLAINTANMTTPLTISGVTRSIAGWLTWRRDAVPQLKGFQQGLRSGIQALRMDVQKKGMAVVTAVNTDSGNDKNVVINIDENALAEEIEQLETTLGTLDGLLSLKNATITIEV